MVRDEQKRSCFSTDMFPVCEIKNISTGSKTFFFNKRSAAFRASVVSVPQF